MFSSVSPSFRRTATGRGLAAASIAALAGALILSACSSGGSSDSAPTVTPTAAPKFAGAWKACPKVKGAQCNKIEVPWNYEDPGSLGSATLDVIRHPAADQSKSLGVLFWNPGGPGSAAADQLPEFVFPKEVVERFDVVAFNPRGTGSSALPCKEGSGMAFVEKTGDLPTSTWDASGQKWAETVTSANTKCAANMGEKARFVGTWQSAGDMDTIRAALGLETISYLGYSYGGRLGAVYASRFPSRVRAMVLDSTLSIPGNIMSFGEGKAVAFSNRFRQLELYCAKQTKNDCGISGGPLKAYDTAMENVRSGKKVKPALTTDQIEMVANDAMMSTGAAELSAVARAFDALRSGSSALLLKLANKEVKEQRPLTEAGIPTADTIPAEPDALANALTAIDCADSSERPDAESVIGLAQKLRTKTPRTALQGASLAGLCLGWPAGEHPIGEVKSSLATPPLVVKVAGDTLVDPRWSNDAVALSTGASLLSWDGFVHGGSTSAGSPCAFKAVGEFLVDPAAAPRSERTCPAD